MTDFVGSRSDLFSLLRFKIMLRVIFIFVVLVCLQHEINGAIISPVQVEKEVPQTQVAPPALGEQESRQFVGIERSYSQLRFDRPIYLTGAGDKSGRIFVVEQGGVVRWFSKNAEAPTSRVFLDISKLVSRRGNEEGLIGFAFHPDFKNNGQLFCHYNQLTSNFFLLLDVSIGPQ